MFKNVGATGCGWTFWHIPSGKRRAKMCPVVFLQFFRGKRVQVPHGPATVIDGLFLEATGENISGKAETAVES